MLNIPQKPANLTIAGVFPIAQKLVEKSFSPKFDVLKISWVGKIVKNGQKIDFFTLPSIEQKISIF